MYSIPHEWIAGDQLLRHTLGVVSTQALRQAVSDTISFFLYSFLSYCTYGQLWNRTKFLVLLDGSLETSSSKITRQTSNILGYLGTPYEGGQINSNFSSNFLTRYLNNPEILSGATFFGLALITGNKSVFALAVFTNLSCWWFLKTVEKYVSK